jgi:hypothetical protein
MSSVACYKMKTQLTNLFIFHISVYVGDPINVYQTSYCLSKSIQNRYMKLMKVV